MFVFATTTDFILTTIFKKHNNTSTYFQHKNAYLDNYNCNIVFSDQNVAKIREDIEITILLEILRECINGAQSLDIIHNFRTKETSKLIRYGKLPKVLILKVKTTNTTMF